MWLCEVGEERVKCTGQGLGVGRVEPGGADAFVVSVRGLVVGCELVQGTGLVAQSATDALEEAANVASEAMPWSAAHDVSVARYQ